MARAVAVVLALAAHAGGPAGAAPADEPIRAGPKEKCPVCGMFVARYPQWMCGVRYQDGTRLLFDGPKDLLKFWSDPGRYGKRTRAGAVAVFVTDYYSLRQVDARTARFVIGSDVLGPMGRELVPFAAEPDARAFMKEHRGQRLVGFDDVTSDVLRELD